MKYAFGQNENQNDCFSRLKLPVILIHKMRVAGCMVKLMLVTGIAAM